MDTYWESNNNLQGPENKLRFLPWVNMAMVIDGDFLVSGSWRWPVGSLVWRRGPGRSIRLAVGPQGAWGKKGAAVSSNGNPKRLDPEELQ